MFAYETQGTNTYLVYDITDNSDIDTLTMGMIINNKIAGFAPAFYTQVDDRKLLKYNVTAKISCSQFFSETVSRRQMLGVFRSILAAVLAADEYMIEPSSIVLDLDYIFVDVSSCAADVICLPVLDRNSVDLTTFFKNIVFSTQYNQKENCDYVAQIISCLNRKAGFSVENFYELVCSLDGASSPKVNVQPQVSPAAPKMSMPQQQTSVPVQPSVPVQQPVPAPQPVPVPQNNAAAQRQQIPVPGAVPQGKSPVAQPAPAQMNIPKPSAPANGQQAAPQQGGDKMSFGYLLMHYSKENAAKYKEAKNNAAPKPAKGAANNSVAGMGFAVPGQPSAPVAAAKPAAPQGAVPVPQPAAIPSSAPMPSSVPMSSPAQNVMPQPHIPAAPQQIQPAMPEGFGGTTVLNSKPVAGDTTILSEYNKASNAASVPYLLRVKNNEKVMLSKEIIRIGKERSFVDYFIGDNSAVSRSHANVISRDGKIYILDTNSTNHTYVNGQIIQSNMEIEIKQGDKIKLANEEFELFMF